MSTSGTVIESDEEVELFNGFGAATFNPQKRTTKRWSFHNNTKPNLVDLPSEAATSQRRLSDFSGIDGVHKPVDPDNIHGGAQLYSTESGRLFHAGKICIVLAGLPGRGKTHLSVSLTRYLRWLGVTTHSYHLGNYRRAAADSLDNDIFLPSPYAPESIEFRQKIVDDCLNDILHFFKHERGQIAIYDAVNALAQDRLELHKRLTALNIQVLFIESLVTNDSIVMKNIEQAAKSSPDYQHWDYDKAYRDYSDRIKFLTPYYQEMGNEDKDLSYIKIINFGERIELHNSNYGYLINKVVFFIMNARIKTGSLFFARCYKNSLDVTDDPPLDEAGVEYAKNVTNTLVNHLKKMGRDYAIRFDDSSKASTPKPAPSIKERQPAAGVDGTDDDSLVVWTSVKKRTVETTQFFAEKGVKIRHRIQLSQKNPGLVGSLTEKEIAEKYPEEYAHYLEDSYHYRFPRAESYHDLSIKIEPLILEMERMSCDILIIADETVIKVFLGYLLLCSCYDIPNLEILSDEILEVKFNAYSNTVEKIKIEDFSKK
jgi:6-phosphofructo-2-kinase/fructose-2,6-biphosphatase 4